MKKTDWPIRWDLLLRYRLIEIIALWEGRLTTNHICHAFGIGRQQASKDINTYLREVAPGNLEYDRHLKGYVPADQFRPAVTQGRSDEYLEVLGRDHALSETFESLDLGLPNTEILHVPRRLAEPEIVRPIVLATRQGRRLEAEYFSLTKPEGEKRTLEPHTLIYSGQRWHVRAWCESNGDYRDFVLSRFRGNPQVMPERSRHKARNDDAWNNRVHIVLRPDQRLSPEQQAIIANDYAMVDGYLRIESRAALVRYMLTLAGLSGDTPHSDPLVQQLELANRDELQAWL